MGLVIPDAEMRKQVSENPIRVLRAGTGLSQVAFGAALNIPRRTIEEWEAGNRSCPPYVVELIAYRVHHDDSIPRRKSKNPEA